MTIPARYTLLVLLLIASAFPAMAQGVKRLVMIKIDGLPGQLVDRYVKETDPSTGKSQLPWIEEAFYRNGTHVDNFYTRGMSLSGPSWSTVDTGQHLQIKGNVEYDRYSLHTYDYLNFVPFYLAFARGMVADMPAVEVLDQLEIPLLADIFPYSERYLTQQLYQRGNRWETIGLGFVHLYPGSPGDLIDEWTMGFDFNGMTMRQAERDIARRVVTQPDLDYLDYYDASFDHVAHGNNDPRAQLADLKKLDRTIGRVWTAIRTSSRAAETALVLVSDHGFNSQEKVYSQGYNLVKLLNKRAGGGHHVVTKRRLMMDYDLKALYPFTPVIATASDESPYLKGQGMHYFTALFDFDGNERASVQLRNSDLNVLHILLLQLQAKKLAADLRRAATDAFFQVIDRHRPEWETMIAGLSEELDALQRNIEVKDREVAELRSKVTSEKKYSPEAVQATRVAKLNGISRREVKDYTRYIAVLKNLMALRKETFDPEKLKVEDLIEPGAMGDHNSIYQLQNYISGPSTAGLSVRPDGGLDWERSFERVNYFELFKAQSVRNNPQPDVSNRPIDFLATDVPISAFGDVMTGDLASDLDPIWLYGGRDEQALILRRSTENGTLIRYLPVSDLTAGSDGTIRFDRRGWAAGLPLRMFEDASLTVPGDRAAWLSEWHTEIEWLKAVHRTKYSNAIIGLIEQLATHQLFDASDDVDQDRRLIRRLRERQRALAQADMLIMANDHWNFDVKGFNPGGNHGSFFRKSTNSTFMIAGGNVTGIPRGLSVDEPYDNLSVMPTLLSLMGRIDGENRPDAGLAAIGFRRFPGRVITEITGRR